MKQNILQNPTDIFIYWADWNTKLIQQADLNGCGVTTLASGLKGPTYVTVDPVNEDLYWSNGSSNAICRSKLDDSATEIFISEDSAVYSMALDLTDGKIYWGIRGALRRADLEGRYIETLIAPDTAPVKIALDVFTGKMYWTDIFHREIRCANLDGSEIRTLVSGRLGRVIGMPLGLALDLNARKMYWADNDMDSLNGRVDPGILRANLDGSGIEVLTTDVGNPCDLALDLIAGKMYWTDHYSDEYSGMIRRANLDGSDIENLVKELYGPTGITFSVGPVIQKNFALPGMGGLRNTDHDELSDLQDDTDGKSYPDDLLISKLLEQDGGYNPLIRKLVQRFELALEARRREERRTINLDVHISNLEQEIHALRQREAGAREDERETIAQNLHDQTNQNLIALNLAFTNWEREREDPALGRYRLEQLKELIDLLLNDTRRFSKKIHTPDPAGNLEEAVRSYIGNWLDSPVKIDYQSYGFETEEIPPKTAIVVYKIIQEAVANAVKHADAEKILVTLQSCSGQIVASIEDNGCGFDLRSVLDIYHMGLSGMRGRAAQVDGQCIIESSSGNGTTVIIRVPL